MTDLPPIRRNLREAWRVWRARKRYATRYFGAWARFVHFLLLHLLRPAGIASAFYAMIVTFFILRPADDITGTLLQWSAWLFVILLIALLARVVLSPRHLVYLACRGAERGNLWVLYLERHFKLLYGEIRSQLPKPHTDLFVLSPFLLAEETDERRRGITYATIAGAIIVSEAERRYAGKETGVSWGAYLDQLIGALSDLERRAGKLRETLFDAYVKCGETWFTAPTRPVQTWIERIPIYAFYLAVATVILYIINIVVQALL